MSQIISRICYECALRPDRCKGRPDIKVCKRLRPDYAALDMDTPSEPDNRLETEPEALPPLSGGRPNLSDDTISRLEQCGVCDNAERIDTEDEPTGKKHDNFIRLRNKRLKKTIHELHLLGNLSMPGYEYSVNEAESIVATLEIAVREIKRRFRL